MSNLRVFVAHNYYQQAGGEDEVFRAETALLEERGHEVYRYTVHNDAVDAMRRLELARATVWNRRSYDDLRDLFASWRPDVVHVHNTLPLISPAIYDAAHGAGAAVVQTLHNYRLFCPPSTFYRNGQVCEACLNRHPWPAVQHACYRDSRAASAAVAATLSFHRWRGTYDKISAFIALTDFAKAKFIQGGLPEEKLFVKPNFIHPAPPPPSATFDSRDPYALFVGRLTPEKGVLTLLEAWREVNGYRLLIVGDGPLADEVARGAGALAGVTFLGRQARDEVLALMRRASLLVFPSRWYEGLPMTVLEAFASGTPVVASRLGGLQDVVTHGENGLHVRPGDPHDLAQKLRWASHHPDALVAMRERARATFEAAYTASTNYDHLLAIYETALA